MAKAAAAKLICSVLAGLTWFSVQGIESAPRLVAYRHLVIDPDPGANGSDVLEKGLGDLNRDGRHDVVLGLGQVNGSPGGLYWYEAPGSGVPSDPWTRHTIVPSGHFYEDVAVADLDGDGAPDIVASVDDHLVWFENPLGHGGDPATDAWTRHMIRQDGGAHVIALADLDGDGKLDIACSSSSVLGSSGAILFQDTPDSWTERRVAQVGESIALLDIGSGKGRINIAGADGDSVVWYENPGESGGDARSHEWARRLAATLPHAEKDAFASGVFTPGGRMDLIVASNEEMPENPPGLYRIVAPEDRRRLWTVETIDPSYQAVHRINVGDMNNDGLMDLVVAEQEQAHNSPPGFDQDFHRQRVAVFLNQGEGSFAEGVVATTGGQNQVIGDVTGDGYPDILSANHGYYGAPNPLELWVSEPGGPAAQR
ncbi:MAG TPA: VCBS repeat-containing protein [Crenalkalicoccus sp.]|nr:VCBS repeat-containing protein [Crenalkalicoccus sp.]